MNIVDFLHMVTVRRRAFKEAQFLYQDRLAPDFSPFDFIDSGELRLSSILAWLLDPHGSHGQGGRFLHSLVVRLSPDAHGSGWPLEVCEKADIRTEFTVGGGRRVDVLVRARDRTLAIENKAGAADLPGQLTSYAAYLDSLQQADTRLIYLTPTGSEPSTQSIDEEQRRRRVESGQLHFWSYREHIVAWMADCRTACRADRVSMFLDEFSRYVSKRFGGVEDMTMQNQIIQDAIRSPETVASAMEIICATEKIREYLISALREQIIAALSERKGWLISSWDLPGWKRFAGFIITLSPQSRYFVHFEFQNKAFNGLVFGVSTTSKPSNEGIAPAAISADIGAGQQNEYWTWFRYASRQDTLFGIEQDWASSAAPWIAIADGSMAKMIVATCDRFQEALIRQNLL